VYRHFFQECHEPQDVHGFGHALLSRFIAVQKRLVTTDLDKLIALPHFQPKRIPEKEQRQSSFLKWNMCYNQYKDKRERNKEEGNSFL
jgi:hypothetical protein